MDGPEQPATAVQAMWWLVDPAVEVPGDVWVELREGVASGSAGCNRFRATYGIGADGSLSFGRSFTTLVACDDARMRLERRVLDAVDSGGRLAHDGQVLLLGPAADVLRFERVEPSADGDWHVVAVHVPERDAIVSDGRPVQAVIEGGSITLVTPSGTVTGTFDAGPRPVTLGDLPAGAAAEDLAVVAAFTGARGWTREGRMLHLRRDDGGIAATLTS